MAYRAKRKFVRSIQRDAVKILSPQGVEYATYEDLSAGGLKLWLDHDMAPTSTFLLEFSFRSPQGASQKISVMARAVRCTSSKDGFEIGVQFLNLSVATRTAIEKLFDVGEGPF
jgi:hypothetical protein